MIDFPETYDELHVPAGAVVRSGGTDLQERLRTHNAQPHIVDLTGIRGFTGIDRSPERTRIGGGTTMAVVARELRATHPALAIATGSLATPQIRAQGTIAGNLTQHTRCWYYRHPDTDCFKSGGDTCPARTGRHLYGVVFDRSACVHPHPSTIAMALLCYETTVVLADGSTRSIEQVLGDGTDPTRHHQLDDGEVISAIELAGPWPQERAPTSERSAGSRPSGPSSRQWPEPVSTANASPNARSPSAASPRFLSDFPPPSRSSRERPSTTRRSALPPEHAPTGRVPCPKPATRSTWSSPRSSKRSNG